MKKLIILVTLAIVIMSCLEGASLASMITSDFEDGTLQGWTKGTPFFNPVFGGDLLITSFGNPGNSLLATDTMSGGGNIFVKAPSTYLGDLSSFSGISWDEYLPGNALKRTVIVIQGGENNTLFTGVASGQSVVNTGTWQNRFIPYTFSSTHWFWKSGGGTDSFEEVIKDMKGLYIQLDVTQSANGNIEARVDNIILVPEPGTLSFIALGGLILRKKRRNK
ncbi:MAG: PEP-CTERM sorting domain-containing protein [Phycisphaerae bacterium]|nr:PEP-CTERM sorting domain-containing protein [Phycisphaerae bacterium]